MLRFEKQTGLKNMYYVYADDHLVAYIHHFRLCSDSDLCYAFSRTELREILAFIEDLYGA